MSYKKGRLKQLGLESSGGVTHLTVLPQRYFNTASTHFHMDKQVFYGMQSILVISKVL